MNINQEREFLKFVKLLNDNDVLKEMILIGSWAEFLYEESEILPKEYEANIQTLDVDFLLKNLKRPMPPKDLMSLAKEDGYITESDILTGVSKIYGENLEIEFLLAKKGAGNELALKTNLGVTAQTLRHLDVLLKNTMIISYMGYNIAVPLPEAYALHKIIINNQRGKKARKDALAIQNIFPYLNKETFNTIYSQLSKREKNSVNAFIKKEILSVDKTKDIDMEIEL